MIMIKQISENIFKLFFNNLGSNCYLIKSEGKNILIDTSGEENRKQLISDLNRISIKPEDIEIILLTHLHYDHIGNLILFKNAGIYASQQEIKDFKNEPFGAVLNENFIEKIVGEKAKTKPTHEYTKIGSIRIESIRKVKFKAIKIVQTPGHTRGSLCFYIPKENRII